MLRIHRARQGSVFCEPSAPPVRWEAGTREPKGAVGQLAWFMQQQTPGDPVLNKVEGEDHTSTCAVNICVPNWEGIKNK